MIMDKYSRILIIIFFMCLINLGLAVFNFSQVSFRPKDQKTISQSLPTLKPTSPSPTPKTNQSDIEVIKSDLTLIKAEIRSLREILGISGTFENLSNIIKEVDSNKR